MVLCASVIILLRNTKFTKKGEEEKEKITKLKHFLERETSFEKKESNEKEIWDRYWKKKWEEEKKYDQFKVRKRKFF